MFKTYFEADLISEETKTPYAYRFYVEEDDRKVGAGAIQFQHDHNNWPNGTTMECVIEALIDRLEHYCDDAVARIYPGYEINLAYNDQAVDCLQEALAHLRSREIHFAAFKGADPVAEPEEEELMPVEEDEDVVS